MSTLSKYTVNFHLNCRYESMGRAMDLLSARQRMWVREDPYGLNRYEFMTLAERAACETGLSFNEDKFDVVLRGQQLCAVYGTAEGRYLTWAGRLAYEPCGTREWDHDNIADDAAIVIGDSHTAYGYRLRPGYEIVSAGPQYDMLWTAADLDAALDELSRRFAVVNKQIDALAEEAERRAKSYGREINERFRARGADKATMDAWWAMGWKNEVSPEEFMDALYRALADRSAFALALTAKSGADLEALGWKCRLSVPRTEAMLEALSRATGIKPATEREYLAWKRRPRTWVFGE